VGFVVDKVTIEQVFLWILWFSHQYESTNAPCSFIHSFIHTSLMLYISATDSIIKQNYPKKKHFSNDWCQENL
jgi:hypothetical protein